MNPVSAPVPSPGQGRPTAGVRRLVLAFMFALLTGTSLAAEGSGTLPAGDASTAMVLNLPRALDADTLLLRNGERRTGHVQVATLRLRIAEAELVFPVSAVAGLDLTDAGMGIATLVTRRHDRLSGFLEGSAIPWMPAPGADLVTVPRDSILKIAFRRAGGDPPAPARGVLVQLRNGDFFTGDWLNDGLRLEPANTPTTWAAGGFAQLTFSQDRDITARVTPLQGPALTGRLVDPELEFQLASGPRLRLSPRRVVHLGPAGPLPAELRARIGIPGILTPGQEAAVHPDPAVQPGGDMVWLPPGEFTMGSPPEEKERDLDEGPLTRVVLPHGFWIGRHEVTQAEYEALMGANPSRHTGDGRFPVERLTWMEAVEYCQRLTAREQTAGRIPPRYVYRLPTEAEWEYACRAGTASRFSHGDDPAASALPAYAWFGDNSDSAPHPVRTRKPNPWGLHDLHGNVLEWCLDAWRGNLPGGTITNAVTLPDGSLRIARGGSWLYPARAARSANRDSYGLLNRCSDLGFRVVLAPSSGRVP